MKKFLIGSGSLLLCLLLVSGCEKNNSNNNTNTNTNNNDNNTNNEDNNEPIVLEEKSYEGIELANLSISNNEVETLVINNSNYEQESLKFSMKIMDSNETVLKEITDTVNTKLAIGTTTTVKTKVEVDLSSAAIIEYSIVE